MYVLWSVAFAIYLALQVSCQVKPKPIGEWHPDKADTYPNPWVKFSECKTDKPSGLCDVQAMLSVDQRNYFIEQPEMQNISNADGCLCNKSCSQPKIMVAVAVMKKIGPQITDYRAAGEEFAKEFRTLWNLDECSVILIASDGDKSSFLQAGPAVVKLLNGTENIDRDIYEQYFMKGYFVDGINQTLIMYRNATAEKAAAEKVVAEKAASEKEAEKAKLVTSASPADDQKDSADKSVGVIVAVVIAVVLVISIVIIIVCVIRQRRKKTRKYQAKEEVRLNPPESV